MLAIVIFALLFFFSRSGVHGRSFSGQRDIITTIQSKHGQVYDCVDFYKQPAFAHPLIKHPASKVRRANEAVVQGKKSRVNANYTSNHSHSLVTSPTVTQTVPDICVAVVRTKADPNKKFLGVEGWPSLYKPKIDGSNNNQYSATRIKLYNGPDSIEAGWMVNPGLFKDEEAHLYVRFKAGEKGCINTKMPGFFYVGQEVALGAVPDRYSQIGRDQYTWKIFIDKHEDDGNWWVSMDEDKYQIGYWPKNLFTGLADVANQVEWGGEVGIYSGKGEWPEMGNGRRAVYDTKYSAFFQHATLANEAGQHINPEDTERFETWQVLYHVLDHMGIVVIILVV